MKQEHLEYLIGQYLDGTLPPEDAAALEKMLQVDAYAQRILQEQIKLDELIKSASRAALPSVQWDNLAAHISSVIDAEAVRAPEPGDIEAQIIAYVDGALDDAGREALEARVASDSTAQELLRQHRSLSAALDDAWKLPAVKWDALAQQISAGVDSAATLSDAQEQQIADYVDGRVTAQAADDVEALLARSAGARQAAQQHERLGVLLKNQADLPLVNWDALAEQISGAVAQQAQSRRLNIGAYLRAAGAFAAAACVAVALWFGIGRGDQSTTPVAHKPAPVIEVAVATPEAAAGAGVVEISIGPSAAYAEASFDRYSPGVVAVETRVQIASVTPVRYEGWSME